jgi:glucan biosynthesis protein C
LVRVRWLPLDLAASLTGSAAWVSVASASLFGWLTLYGLLGVCAPLARYGGRAIKYLSDSSYWVYLTHFPVVGLAQAILFLVALPSSVKFLIALAIGLAFSLLTYEACVRRTWIGRWLRGGGAPRPVVASLVRPPSGKRQPAAKAHMGFRDSLRRGWRRS